MDETIIIWSLVGIATILNILVSVYLFNRSDLELIQKIVQALIVWLVPFIAALGLWLFNRSHDVNEINKQPFGGGANDSIGVQPPSGSISGGD
jgi:hypothetical protein